MQMASGGLPRSISWYSVRLNSCRRVISRALLNSIDLRRRQQFAGLTDMRVWSFLGSCSLLCIRIPDFPGYDAVVLLRVLEGMDEQIVGGLVGPLTLCTHSAIHE